MSKKLFTLALFIFIVKISTAQTIVTIIGTAHFKTSSFDADTLYKILNAIKPDVILQELDTALMDHDGNYKGRAILDTGNEHIASVRYKRTNTNVIFRPFDIAGRSVYYSSHNTFANENKLWKDIDSLFKKGEISKDNMQIVSVLYAANSTLNILYDMNVKTLNSKDYMRMAAFGEDWLYNKQLEVIAGTPGLKRWYDFFKDDGDFWATRNHAMINNILGYIKTFKGKKIVVLTGAMHKYFLTDSLDTMQSQYQFKLMELPD
jgi:hypothetical protein